MEMRSVEEVKQAANYQEPVADYVCLGRHVTPGIVRVKKTGDLMATWRLEGVTFETSDPQAVLAQKDALHNFVKSLGGGRFAIWTHKVRRRVRERLDAAFPNAFIQSFNDAYYAKFDERDDEGNLKHQQIATELYVTIIFRPLPSRASRMFNKLTVRSIEDIRAQEKANVASLEDAGNQLEASLSRYTPERLSTFVKNDIVFTEMGSFYGYLVNGVWDDVPLREGELAEYIPVSRMFFGDNNGMAEIWHPLAKKFVGFLDIQDYPRRSEPGMSNGLLYGDYEYIETQSFSILNKNKAISALKDQQGHLKASEDVSPHEIKEMDSLIEQVNSGHVAMGEYHYSLAIFGDSLEAVAVNMSHARTVMVDGPGFTMALNDAIPECGWYSQIPGNWHLRPREASITSKNFVAMSPFHNFARGKRKGNPWGEALALLKTPSGQPYYLNYHGSRDDEDVTDKKLAGNVAVIGTTGVGKTTFVISMMLFQTKYHGFRGVFFDKDRGSEIAIRRVGGRYFPIHRNVPTGFAPFQLPPTENNIAFATDLVWLCAGPGEVSQRAKEEADVENAVRLVMSDSIRLNLRRMSAIWQRLPNEKGGNSLRDRLKKWTGNNLLGWVFDNPRDTQGFDDETVQLRGYDYTELLDTPSICVPVVAFLLHCTDNLIQGSPFAFWMEEFWKVLENEYFEAFAKDKLKTIRKLFGLGVFLTQSPSDVVKSPISKTVIEQCVTKFYLPNPSADHDDYVNHFKVTEQEFKLIRSFEEQSRMMLVKQGDKSAVLQFDLGGMDEFIDIMSGDLPNVELLDGIRAEVGDDPAVWAPIFHERIAARRAAARRRHA